MATVMVTHVEREKFASWLEQEALRDDAMAKQMASLPHAIEVVKHLRMKAGAQRIVAKELRSVEDVSIS